MSTTTVTGDVASPAAAVRWQGRADGILAALERSPWLGLALLAGAWFALCAPWLVDGQIIPWDAKNHFYPILRFVAQSIHSGQSPAWNPYHMSGYPMIADPQSMIFSPLMASVAALWELPSFRVVDAAELLHLLIGGGGVFLLCRSYGWHPAAGFAAALVFMFGGPASSRLQHTGMILSYGYLPVALLLLKITLDRASRGHAAAFGLIAAIMAVNRDQIAFLGCLLLLAYAGTRIGAADDRRAFFATRWPALAVAGAVGAAALALPVLLTLQLLELSNRPQIGLDAALLGSLAPVNLLTLAMPDFFKSTIAMDGYWGPGGLPWSEDDWTDRAIDYLYVGLLPLVLVLWHGVVGGRLWGRQIRFHAIVLGLALLYAIGRHTPFFQLLYEIVPGVDLYRRPADATFLLVFALALTTGYLLDRLLTEGAPVIGRRRAALALTAAAAVLAGALALAASHGQFAHAALCATAAVALVGALAIALVLAGRASPATRRLAVWGFAALLAVDLGVQNAGNVLNAHPADTLALYEEPDEDSALGLLSLRLARIYADEPHPYYRAEIIGLGGAWQNAPMVFNIEATLGYNPLRLRDYQAFTGASETSYRSDRQFTRFMRSYRSTLANLLGIRFVLTAEPIEELDPRLRAGDLKLVERVGGLRLYENPNAFPRTMFVPRAFPIDTDGILAGGTLPQVDFRTTVLLDATASEWALAEAAISPVPGDLPEPTIVQYGNTEVRIRVVAPTNGFVVLNDLWYPGWRVFVDDEEQELMRANILFRAVRVPAGSHEVVFRYEPLSLRNLIATLGD